MIESDYVFLIILYLIIGTVFTIYLLKNKKKDTPTRNGFLFGMLLYYIIIPIIMLLNVEDLNAIELAKGKYSTGSVERFVINGEFSAFVNAMFMLIVAFLTFNLLYKFTGNFKEKKFDEKKTLILVKIFMYFTFITGTVAFILLINSFESIKNALYYAEYLRSFSSDLVSINSNENLGFYILLTKFIIVSPLLLIYLIINSDGNKKIIYNIMLIVSLFISGIYFLFNAGRAPLLLFILCFVYYIMYKKKFKRPWIWIIVLSACALPILNVLDQLFAYFNTGIFKLSEISYLKNIDQFSFPYKNNLILNNLVNEYGLRYGSDFITTFLDLLPGVAYPASYVNTSEYIVGINWRELGGIPNDFITFSYIQASIAGVIALSGVMGIITGILDRKISQFNNIDSKKFISAVMSIYVFNLVPYADFVGIIKGQFILIIFTIIIMLSSKRK